MYCLPYLKNIIIMKTNNKNNKSNAEILNIPLDKIHTSKLNPRQYFDENSLIELSESIKKVGVIQPITVRKSKKGTFEIICGERRYRASVLAQMPSIPACLKECTDTEFLDIALIENIQREDVSEIETAETIKSFIDANKEDFNSMAIRLGKSVKYVRDRYQLNSLIDEIKALVHTNVLSVAKAVLLASYEQDIQKSVLDKYLHNQFNSWLELSYTKFANNLNSHFNTNLCNAKFDISDCLKCPFNSAISSLFVEDENKQCFKKSCFMEKQQNFSIQKAIAQLEEYPTYMIIQSYSDSWFLKALEEQGFTIANSSDVKYTNYPTPPQQPEEPQESDYIDEETKALDVNEWVTAKGEYEEEIQEYQKNFKEYEQEIKGIELKIEERKIERCFVICGTTLGLEMRYLSEEETAIDEDISSSDKLQLEKLNKKDEQNQAVKVRNSVKDIKEQLFPNDSHFTDVEATKAEQDIFFFYVFGELSRATVESFFDGKYPSEKEQFEFISNMTAEQRMSIIRSFIVSKLRCYAYNNTQISTQFLLEFAKLHKEKETLEILAKYQSVYDKRKLNIEAKKKEFVSADDLEVIENETEVKE